MRMKPTPSVSPCGIHLHPSPVARCIFCDRVAADDDYEPAPRVLSAATRAKCSAGGKASREVARFGAGPAR